MNENYKASIYFLLSFILCISACSSDYEINIDKSFSQSEKPASLYKDAIKQANRFLKKYNDSLNFKIHESFLNDFYFYENNHFNVDIIFSNNKHSLIYIEKKSIPQTKFNIYFSKKDPQFFIQELKNNFSAYIIPNDSFMSVYSDPYGGGRAFIYGHITFVGSPLPYDICSTSFFATYSSTIKIIEPNDSLVTDLPGISLLIGSPQFFNFRELIDSTAFDMVHFEIRDKYIESDLFRKALLHPVLKAIAEEINAKKAKADNKIKEYPLWEFEKDINRMRTVAKQNYITENYVDDMIKDSQYYPVSGTLLYYYSNPRQYMYQLTFINLILFVLIFIVKGLLKLKSIKVYNTLATCLLFVNSYFFYKKPDFINIIYWLIPGIILLCSYLLLYFQTIKRILKL